MSHELLIASIDRAGGHIAILGIAVVIAVVGLLVYGLIQLVKSRTGRDPKV